jgi:hypothetical protein
MVWTIRKNDATRITTLDIWFMRCTVDCTKWVHKQNDKIMKQLKTERGMIHGQAKRTGEIMLTECMEGSPYKFYSTCLGAEDL